MATVKALKAKAREYFYSSNFADLEDVMNSLNEKSPVQAGRLRREFEDIIMEHHLLDEIGELDL